MSTIIRSRHQAEVDREVAIIRREGKKVARSKKSAREFLIRAGMITKSGKLTKRYR